MHPHPVRAGTVERAAYLFYAIAAAGSSVGQVWVGVATAPWPTGLPAAWRIVAVAPFALVIDLGGVVTAAFADTRQRLGETAISWRILSASSVTAGVAINIIGHRDSPYLAVVFGGLGSFAYAVWLMHSAARRRDALRADGKLSATPPVYGPWRWLREPTLTRLARDLALEHGHGLFESLTAARTQIRTEHRRGALAAHVEQLIRAQHDDPVLAAIAVGTLDVDALATQLAAQADILGWAATIAATLTAPATPARAGGSPPGPPALPADVLRTVPSTAEEYRRWREMWAQIRTEPTASTKTLADRLGTGVRTVQRIRAVGPTGLLDSPIPPAVRLAQLATQPTPPVNGHHPGELVPITD